TCHSSPGPRSSAPNGSPEPPSTGSPTAAESSRPKAKATGSATPRPAPPEPQPPPRSTKLRPASNLQPKRSRFRPAHAPSFDQRSHLPSVGLVHVPHSPPRAPG